MEQHQQHRSNADGSSKGETRRGRKSTEMNKCIVFFVVFLFGYSAGFSQHNYIHIIESPERRKAILANCDSLKKIGQSPCELISFILSLDSSWSREYKQRENEIDFNCLIDMLFQLRDMSGINPHFYPRDGYPGYANRILGKTIYTIDLLYWMRYFRCADTTKLRSKIRGNFSESELKQINGIMYEKKDLAEKQKIIAKDPTYFDTNFIYQEKERILRPFDTMILYENHKQK